MVKKNCFFLPRLLYAIGNCRNNMFMYDNNMVTILLCMESPAAAEEDGMSSSRAHSFFLFTLVRESNEYRGVGT